MNTETFAEFYRRCGYATFRSTTTCWYKAHPLFLMSLPYHSELSLAPGEMDEVFDANRSVLGARYFGRPSGPGRASFLIVCRDKEYDLPTLGHKARNQTRYGLCHCEVRPVNWQEAARAHDLQRETCIRQGRKPEFTTRQWCRLCEAAASVPGFEAWGAFAKGGLAALALVSQCDEHASILYQYSRTALLSERPNNALVFMMTRELLARPGIEVVCYGPEPLEDLGNLNRFKFEMGYSPQPIRQLGIISPYWRGVASPIVHRCIVKIAGWTRPGSSFRKAAGISNLVQATLPAAEPTPVETETPYLLPAPADFGQELPQRINRVVPRR
jgi:hypothetical protein